MSQVKTVTPRSKTQSPDALALLEADHELVQDLFDKFQKARTDQQKASLAERICTELTIHAQIEEEILYPAVREAIDDDNLMDEADVEHAGAKDLIAQIEASEPGEDHFEAKVTVLGEYVKHHVNEEQSEMFPKIRKAELDLKELGLALSTRKAELQAEVA